MTKEDKDDSSDYFEQLILSMREKSQEDYDKTVLALSGGALGISIAFISDIIGDDPIKNVNLLIAAWSCWATSLTSVLMSHYIASISMTKALKDHYLDDESDPHNIWSKFTSLLNFLSGFTFIGEW